MQIEFSKMHGLGNDFVVIDAINQDINLSSAQIAQISDRHLGVGCDQLLLVEKANTANYDFFYRIFNADGSEAQQCGNGARCFLHFAQHRGLTDKNHIRVEMINGDMVLERLNNDLIRASLTAPNFAPEALPFEAPQQTKSYALALQDSTIEVGAVSMGNPHAVTLVNHIGSDRVQIEGPQIESHSRFPEKVNAGFMQIVDRGNIQLRVFERGAGETLACGSGACAAVAVGQLWDLLNDKVHVQLLGGELIIEWQGENAPLYMTGPTALVFDGQLTLL